MTIEEMITRLYELNNHIIKIGGSVDPEVVIGGQSISSADFYWCEECGRVEIGPNQTNA